MLLGVGGGGPALEPVPPREDEPHASSNAVSAPTTMAQKKNCNFLFFLVLWALHRRIKLGTSNHIA